MIYLSISLTRWYTTLVLSVYVYILVKFQALPPVESVADIYVFVKKSMKDSHTPYIDRQRVKTVMIIIIIPNIIHLNRPIGLPHGTSQSVSVRERRTRKNLHKK